MGDWSSGLKSALKAVTTTKSDDGGTSISDQETSHGRASGVEEILADAALVGAIGAVVGEYDASMVGFMIQEVV